MYDNANFAYRNTEYFAVFQCKLMKKLLDLDARGGARVHQATTWSFYFEGERFFKGTPEPLHRAGDREAGAERLPDAQPAGRHAPGRQSTRAWSLEGLDGGETAMPEEIDALATAGRDGVSVLVWRHADDQYATAARDTEVVVRLERLPFGGARLRVSHWRIDGTHSNSHAAWRALGAPQDPWRSDLRAIEARQRLERVEPDRDRDGARRRADGADRAAAPVCR